jgi:hypothetical protein
MVESFAFGDFVFRMPDGTEVDRARDLKSLEEKLHTVPVESIAFHGERNHFSNWFTARTEFALARKLKPRTVSEFATLEHLRHDLIASIAEYRREQSDTLVADFDRATFDPTTNFFARIGGGSLGGKARGLAFVRYLLNYHGLNRRFPRVHIAVPPAVVLATDCFDRFLRRNDLLDLAFGSRDDQEIIAAFLRAELPGDTIEHLRAFVDAVQWPLAVRSSSLLEDSQYQPFTGIYETFMLPNNHLDVGERLEQLMAAIKRVYASTFMRRAKDHLAATPYRLEEEKMAVVLQKVVGSRHGDRFYPDFSGVARSYNYYPVAPLTPEDGVAAVALGLGRTVVEGGDCLTFCRATRTRSCNSRPSRTSCTTRSASSGRWSWTQARPATPSGRCVRRASGSTSRNRTVCCWHWAPRIPPRTTRVRRAVAPGCSARVVRSGAQARCVPLAETLTTLLEVGSQGMNRPAEIEFAVRLGATTSRTSSAFLQMRPLVLSRETSDLNVDEVSRDVLLAGARG